MNRQLSLLSALMLASALASSACNKKEEAPAAEPTAPAPSAPSAAEPSATAPSAPAPSGSANSGIPECDSYLAKVEKYMSCDKVPQAARDAAKQGIEASKQGWAALNGANVPEASKLAAASGCKQGEDALIQGAKALGCTL